MLKLPPGPFEGFIFDCDGTIADTMPLHYTAWQSALGRWGAALPEDLFYRLGGTKTERVAEIVKERAGANFSVTEMVQAKEDFFVSHLGEVQPILPVVEIIRAWEGKVPMAVASGGMVGVITLILENLGLTEYFDAVVTAEDVVYGKPHPETFLRAAHLLGVTPQKCLVFEDSPTGIEAAEAAGMAWVEVTREIR